MSFSSLNATTIFITLTLGLTFGAVPLVIGYFSIEHKYLDYRARLVKAEGKIKELENLKDDLSKLKELVIKESGRVSTASTEALVLSEVTGRPEKIRRKQVEKDVPNKRVPKEINPVGGCVFFNELIEGNIFYLKENDGLCNKKGSKKIYKKEFNIYSKTAILHDSVLDERVDYLPNKQYCVTNKDNKKEYCLRYLSYKKLSKNDYIYKFHIDSVKLVE